MMPRHQKLEIHPFQILQRLVVAVDDVVLSLLAAIDVEHLIAFLRQSPKTLLGAGFEQFHQRFAFFIGIAFGGFEGARLNYLLKAWVEGERWNYCGFDCQSQKPECGLSESENAECSC